MAKRLRILTLLVCALLATARNGLPQRFFPDDPIGRMPPPLPVPEARSRGVNQLYDFLHNSFKAERGVPVPAGAINTLGEVPDSEWFTNRHEKLRMNRDQLQRGAGADNIPLPPFTIVGAKTSGVAPGFQMRDSAGRLYFVKLDPLKFPEMASAAEVILSKFLYAAGYNAPENYILYGKSSDFIISPNARLDLSDYNVRKMVWRDFQNLLDQSPQSADGSFRMLASLGIEGEILGPFRYRGTRSDDPNDTVPHEHRRDLRALSVLMSWLNNTDAKANNTVDTIVEENGTRFIKHYLIDFSSALGSDTILPKDPQFGHEFAWPETDFLLQRILTFGLVPQPWERAKFPEQPAAGNFESAIFDPGEWKSNYPNQAFINSLPDDNFWGAKIVMAFTDDDIRAIAETGGYTDPHVTDLVTARLIERRDKIGRYHFSTVLPLDRFRVENGELRFDDLAAKCGFRLAGEYVFQWSRFDNVNRQHHPLPDSTASSLPAEAATASIGAYYSAVIRQRNEGPKSVTVTIRKTQEGYDVFGVERTW